MQHFGGPILVTAPVWHFMGCAFNSDALQSMWLPNGELLCPSGNKVPLKWAPGEFQFFVQTLQMAYWEPYARDLAQRIYWGKLRQEYLEMSRWSAHVQAWKAKAQSKLASKKTSEEVKEIPPQVVETKQNGSEAACEPKANTESKVVSEKPEKAEANKITDKKTTDIETTNTAASVAPAKKNPTQVLPKSKRTKKGTEFIPAVLKKKVRYTVKAAKKQAKRQLKNWNLDPIVEVDEVDDVEVVEKEEVKPQIDIKDESGSDSDSSKNSEKESSTAETTPEVSPKSSKTNLLAFKSDSELEGSEDDKSKKKTTKVVKRSKKNDQRQAKKLAKKATNSALSDQSVMFSLSKLQKA